MKYIEQDTDTAKIGKEKLHKNNDIREKKIREKREKRHAFHCIYTCSSEVLNITNPREVGITVELPVKYIFG